jgi:APA family basic amino acid/polyamine antiporter
MPEPLFADKLTASSNRQSQAVPGGLSRQLGLGSAVAAVAGESIAVGIFLTPAGMARSLGSPFWLLIVWLAMGAMALSGALCYGELAARVPAAGGGYVYLREACGPRLAFLYGWMSFLVLDPGVTAALAVGMASYAAYIIGLSPGGIKLAAILTIMIVATLNIRHTRLGAGFLRGMTALKLGVLGLLAFWALAKGAGDWNHFVPFVAQRPGSEPLLTALAGSYVAAFFSFGGWWDVSKIAGEVQNPKRTLPLALALGVLVVTGVYVLMSSVFVYVVPLDRVSSDETFVAQAGARVFGPAGGNLLALIVVACVLGSLAAIIMAAPRVYYAMACDGLFFPSVASLHPRFGTPARAIGLHALVACLIVALGTFNQIIAYFVFVAVIFIGLTVAGLFRLKAAGRDERSFGFPWTATTFLTLIVLLLVLLAISSPKQAFLGVGVAALGVPFYRLLHFKAEAPGNRDPSRNHDD